MNFGSLRAIARGSSPSLCRILSVQDLALGRLHALFERFCFPALSLLISCTVLAPRASAARFQSFPKKSFGAGGAQTAPLEPRRLRTRWMPPTWARSSMASFLCSWRPRRHSRAASVLVMKDGKLFAAKRLRVRRREGTKSRLIRRPQFSVWHQFPSYSLGFR